MKGDTAAIGGELTLLHLAYEGFERLQEALRIHLYAQSRGVGALLPDGLGCVPLDDETDFHWDGFGQAEVPFLIRRKALVESIGAVQSAAIIAERRAKLADGGDNSGKGGIAGTSASAIEALALTATLNKTNSGEGGANEQDGASRQTSPVPQATSANASGAASPPRMRFPLPCSRKPTPKKPVKPEPLVVQTPPPIRTRLRAATVNRRTETAFFDDEAAKDASTRRSPLSPEGGDPSSPSSPPAASPRILPKRRGGGGDALNGSVAVNVGNPFSSFASASSMGDPSASPTTTTTTTSPPKRKKRATFESSILASENAKRKSKERQSNAAVIDFQSLVSATNEGGGISGFFESSFAANGSSAGLLGGNPLNTSVNNASVGAGGSLFGSLNGMGTSLNLFTPDAAPPEVDVSDEDLEDDLLFLACDTAFSVSMNVLPVLDTIDKDTFIYVVTRALYRARKHIPEGLITLEGCREVAAEAFRSMDHHGTKEGTCRWDDISELLLEETTLRYAAVSFRQSSAESYDRFMLKDWPAVPPTAIKLVPVQESPQLLVMDHVTRSGTSTGRATHLLHGRDAYSAAVAVNEIMGSYLTIHNEVDLSVKKYIVRAHADDIKTVDAAVWVGQMGHGFTPMLLIFGGDMSIHVFDYGPNAVKPKLTRTHVIHSDTTQTSTLLLDNDKLVCGSRDGFLSCYNLKTLFRTGRGDAIGKIIVTDDANQPAIPADTNRARSQRYRRSNASSMPAEGTNPYASTFYCDDDDDDDFASDGVHHDNNSLIGRMRGARRAAGELARLQHVDLEDGVMGQISAHRKQPITGIQRISPIALISGGLDGYVSVIHIPTWSITKQFMAEPSGITGLTYSSLHQVFVTYTFDTVIKLWAGFSGTNPLTFRDSSNPHTRNVINVTILREAPHIVSMDGDGVVKTWDIRSTVCLHTKKLIAEHEFQSHSNSCHSVVYQPKYRRVIAIAKNFNHAVAQFVSGASFLTAHGSDRVQFLALAKSSGMIVSSTVSETKIWDGSRGGLRWGSAGNDQQHNNNHIATSAAAAGSSRNGGGGGSKSPPQSPTRTGGGGRSHSPHRSNSPIFEGLSDGAADGASSSAASGGSTSVAGNLAGFAAHDKTALCVDGDGNKIAFATVSGTIHEQRLSTGRIISNHTTFSPSYDKTKPDTEAIAVVGLAFASSTKELVAVCANGTIRYFAEGAESPYPSRVTCIWSDEEVKAARKLAEKAAADARLRYTDGIQAVPAAGGAVPHLHRPTSGGAARSMLRGLNSASPTRAGGGIAETAAAEPAMSPAGPNPVVMCVFSVATQCIAVATQNGRIKVVRIASPTGASTHEFAVPAEVTSMAFLDPYPCLVIADSAGGISFFLIRPAVLLSVVECFGTTNGSGNVPLKSSLSASNGSTAPRNTNSSGRSAPQQPPSATDPPPTHRFDNLYQWAVRLQYDYGYAVTMTLDPQSGHFYVADHNGYMCVYDLTPFIFAYHLQPLWGVESIDYAREMSRQIREATAASGGGLSNPPSARASVVSASSSSSPLQNQNQGGDEWWSSADVGSGPHSPSRSSVMFRSNNNANTNTSHSPSPPAVSAVPTLPRIASGFFGPSYSSSAGAAAPTAWGSKNGSAFATTATSFPLTLTQQLFLASLVSMQHHFRGVVVDGSDPQMIEPSKITTARERRRSMAVAGGGGGNGGGLLLSPTANRNNSIFGVLTPSTPFGVGGGGDNAGGKKARTITFAGDDGGASKTSTAAAAANKQRNGSILSWSQEYGGGAAGANNRSSFDNATDVGNGSFASPLSFGSAASPSSASPLLNTALVVVGEECFSLVRRLQRDISEVGKSVLEGERLCYKKLARRASKVINHDGSASSSSQKNNRRGGAGNQSSLNKSPRSPASRRLEEFSDSSSSSSDDSDSDDDSSNKKRVTVNNGSDDEESDILAATRVFPSPSNLSASSSKRLKLSSFSNASSSPKDEFRFEYHQLIGGRGGSDGLSSSYSNSSAAAAEPLHLLALLEKHCQSSPYYNTDITSHSSGGRGGGASAQNGRRNNTSASPLRRGERSTSSTGATAIGNGRTDSVTSEAAQANIDFAALRRRRQSSTNAIKKSLFALTSLNNNNTTPSEDEDDEHDDVGKSINGDRGTFGRTKSNSAATATAPSLKTAYHLDPSEVNPRTIVDDYRFVHSCLIPFVRRVRHLDHVPKPEELFKSAIPSELLAFVGNGGGGEGGIAGTSASTSVTPSSSQSASVLSPSSPSFGSSQRRPTIVRALPSGSALMGVSTREAAEIQMMSEGMGGSAGGGFSTSMASPSSGTNSKARIGGAGLLSSGGGGSGSSRPVSPSTRAKGSGGSSALTKVFQNAANAALLSSSIATNMDVLGNGLVVVSNNDGGISLWLRGLVSKVTDINCGAIYTSVVAELARQIGATYKASRGVDMSRANLQEIDRETKNILRMLGSSGVYFDFKSVSETHRSLQDTYREFLWRQSTEKTRVEKVRRDRSKRQSDAQQREQQQQLLGGGLLSSPLPHSPTFNPAAAAATTAAAGGGVHRATHSTSSSAFASPPPRRASTQRSNGAKLAVTFETDVVAAKKKQNQQQHQSILMTPKQHETRRKMSTDVDSTLDVASAPFLMPGRGTATSSACSADHNSSNNNGSFHFPQSASNSFAGGSGCGPSPASVDEKAAVGPDGYAGGYGRAGRQLSNTMAPAPLLAPHHLSGSGGGGGLFIRGRGSIDGDAGQASTSDRAATATGIKEDAACLPLPIPRVMAGPYDVPSEPFRINSPAPPPSTSSSAATAANGYGYGGRNGAASTSVTEDDDDDDDDAVASTSHSASSSNRSSRAALIVAARPRNNVNTTTTATAGGHYNTVSTSGIIVAPKVKLQSTGMLPPQLQQLVPAAAVGGGVSSSCSFAARRIRGDSSYGGASAAEVASHLVYHHPAEMSQIQNTISETKAARSPMALTHDDAVDWVPSTAAAAATQKLSLVTIIDAAPSPSQPLLLITDGGGGGGGGATERRDYSSACPSPPPLPPPIAPSSSSSTGALTVSASGHHRRSSRRGTTVSVPQDRTTITATAAVSSALASGQTMIQLDDDNGRFGGAGCAPSMIAVTPRRHPPPPALDFSASRSGTRANVAANAHNVAGGGGHSPAPPPPASALLARVGVSSQPQQRRRIDSLLPSSSAVDGGGALFLQQHQRDIGSASPQRRATSGRSHGGAAASTPRGTASSSPSPAIAVTDARLKQTFGAQNNYGFDVASGSSDKSAVKPRVYSARRY